MAVASRVITAAKPVARTVSKPRPPLQSPPKSTGISTGGAVSGESKQTVVQTTVVQEPIKGFQLQTGEYVDPDVFYSLPTTGRVILNTQGIDAFNQYLSTRWSDRFLSTMDYGSIGSGEYLSPLTGDNLRTLTNTEKMQYTHPGYDEYTAKQSLISDVLAEVNLEKALGIVVPNEGNVYQWYSSKGIDFPKAVAETYKTGVVSPSLIPLIPKVSISTPAASSSLSILDPYKTASGYNLVAALDSGISKETLVSMGFTQKQVNSASRELRDWRASEGSGVDILYEISQQVPGFKTGEGYDLMLALDSGISWEMLVDAGFTDDQVGIAAADLVRSRTAGEIKTSPLYSIEKSVPGFKTDQGYNLVAALDAGISETDLVNAGFKVWQVNQAERDLQDYRAEYRSYLRDTVPLDSGERVDRASFEDLQRTSPEAAAKLVELGTQGYTDWITKEYGRESLAAGLSGAELGLGSLAAAVDYSASLSPFQSKVFKAMYGESTGPSTLSQVFSPVTPSKTTITNWEKALLPTLPQMWQGLTPWKEEYGETVHSYGIPKAIGVMGAEIAVPGVYTARHWGEMSTGWKAGSLGMDVLAVVPIVGGLSTAVRYGADISRAGLSVGKAVLKSPITMITQPGKTFRTVLTPFEIFTSWERVPLTIFERGTYSPASTLRIPFEYAGRKATMEARDILTRGAILGERAVVPLGKGSIEYFGTGLQDIIGPAAIHTTGEYGANWARGGLVLSKDVYFGPSMYSGFGLGWSDPGIIVWRNPLTYTRGKSWAGTAELEEIVSPRTMLTAPYSSQELWMRGPGLERVPAQIWGPLITKPQLLKMKIQGIINVPKFIVQKPLKISGFSGMPKWQQASMGIGAGLIGYSVLEDKEFSLSDLGKISMAVVPFIKTTPSGRIGELARRSLSSKYIQEAINRQIAGGLAARAIGTSFISGLSSTSSRSRPLLYPTSISRFVPFPSKVISTSRPSSVPILSGISGILRTTYTPGPSRTVYEPDFRPSYVPDSPDIIREPYSLDTLRFPYTPYTLDTPYSSYPPSVPRVPYIPDFYGIPYIPDTPIPPNVPEVPRLERPPSITRPPLPSSELDKRGKYVELTTGVTPKDSGEVSPESNYYRPGDTVKVEAMALSGYRFIRWIGDVPKSMTKRNPMYIPMDSNKRVLAVFAATSPRTERLLRRRGKVVMPGLTAHFPEPLGTPGLPFEPRGFLGRLNIPLAERRIVRA